MKQNPFSLYDFLGYFVPGALLIYIVFIIRACKFRVDITPNDILGSFPNLTLEGIVLLIIVSYLLGHVLSFISSITVEIFAVWKYGYPSRYLLDMKKPRFRDHFKTFHGIFWGILILLFLLPVVVLDTILGSILGLKMYYTKKLDAPLIKLIILKVNALTNKLGVTTDHGFKPLEGNQSDFFRIVQHYTYENSKSHQSKFSNYVALYGFLRTMTFIFNVVFWYLIVHGLIVNNFNKISFILIILSCLVSYTLFMAFMKFYRRFTLEGFMVLVADKEIK